MFYFYISCAHIISIAMTPSSTKIEDNKSILNKVSYIKAQHMEFEKLSKFEKFVFLKGKHSLSSKVQGALLFCWQIFTAVVESGKNLKNQEYLRLKFTIFKQTQALQLILWCLAWRWVTLGAV